MFFVFGLLISCDKPSEVIFGKQGNITIRPQGASIKEAVPAVWNVGPAFRQFVHKGVRVTLDFPLLREDQLMAIAKQNSANSFLIRVRRSNYIGQQILGFFDVPFRTRTAQNIDSIHELRFTTFAIYYADAALSLRFERMQCPALGTQKIVSLLEIGGAGSNNSSSIIIDPMEEEIIHDRVQEFNFYTTVINGGKELIGNYHFEFAFYDNLKKKRLSSYYQFPGELKIIAEQDKVIKGCNNFSIPPRSEDRDVRSIKFGK